MINNNEENVYGGELNDTDDISCDKERFYVKNE